MSNPATDMLYRIRALTAGPLTLPRAGELAELVDELDAYLSGGGLLPRPWSPEYIHGQLQAIADSIRAEFDQQHPPEDKSSPDQ